MYGPVRKLSFGGLEICRQPCEPPRVDSRGSRVPWRVVVLADGPGKSSGRPGREPLLELQVVLWFCGGSTEKHCQECRGPASSALQVRGRVGLE